MSVPLTIENFEFQSLQAKASEIKSGGKHNYYSISFEYKDNKALIKINGSFIIFKHNKSSSYSLGIRLDDENEGFLEDLKKRIRELSCNFKTYPKLKLKPADLELIRPNSNGRYKNVYTKIYTKAGKPKIPISERINSKESFKRRRIDINELIDESFEGTCAYRTYRVYVGSANL